MQHMRMMICFIVGLLVTSTACGQNEKAQPRIVGHRGLMRHAPENTLAGFSACIQLRLGFELDIRRTKDGVLVCVHDDDVKRTTDGKGKVSDFTLAELQKLDAGRWFGREFAGERVPTLDAVFAMLRKMGIEVLVALDFKVEDETVQAEVIALANKHGVLKQMVCIGTTISSPEQRATLRKADAKAPVAALANKAEELPGALADKNADWVYLRFIPTVEQVTRIHAQGKHVFLVGPLVAGNEPENWRRGYEVGVDAILTDYPLECRQLFRSLQVK
jgi:glycerophosphoryl diester phosphodiesterase